MHFSCVEMQNEVHRWNSLTKISENEMYFTDYGERDIIKGYISIRIKNYSEKTEFFTRALLSSLKGWFYKKGLKFQAH